MTDRTIELVTQLGLRPHPEGGYYREVHRSDLLVQPPDGRDLALRSRPSTSCFQPAR